MDQNALFDIGPREEDGPAEPHQQRYGQVPDEALVDGGFAKKEDIEKVEQGGTTVYSPVQKSKDPERDLMRAATLRAAAAGMVV